MPILALEALITKMRLISKAVTTFCILAVTGLAAGASLPEFSYHLSNNRINAIAQAPDGFLWFGTAHGLNRYSGENFLTWYASDQPGDLNNDLIYDICFDAEGVMWLATECGIIHYEDGGFVNRFGEDEPIISTTLDRAIAEGIRAGLTDLQHYARENYAEEASCALDLAPLLREIRSSLSPDCEANGILLNVVPAAVTVYAKPKMLISVLHNLVFNAIEHAECSCIEITAERTPKACRIRVIDDGKGIETGEDVFRPYYSEHPARENMGLGLYLCRQFLRSMGGDLTYERASKRTVFTATLPRSPRHGPLPH